MSPPWDLLLTDTAGGGAIAVTGDRIAWTGPTSALPAGGGGQARTVWPVDGRLVTPGLVDCHTHLAFAGDRSGKAA